MFMRTLIALTLVAALAACSQQNEAKSEAPADAASTDAAPTDAAPATDGKPQEPEQAPAGATPNKPS